MTEIAFLPAKKEDGPSRAVPFFVKRIRETMHIVLLFTLYSLHSPLSMIGYGNSQFVYSIGALRPLDGGGRACYDLPH